MVLKLATEYGWVFIDGVKEINVNAVDIQKYNETLHFSDGDYIRQGYTPTGKFYNNIILFHHKMNEGKIYSNDTNVEFGVVELIPTLNNGEQLIYITDLAAYLLSDIGKTIERIN